MVAKCQIFACSKRAYYGTVQWQPRRCRDHKTSEDRHVTSYYCQHSECEKYAYYGPQDSLPQWCREHAENTSVLRHTSLCDFPDCHKRPDYGFPGKKANSVFDASNARHDPRSKVAWNSQTSD